MGKHKRRRKGKIVVKTKEKKQFVRFVIAASTKLNLTKEQLLCLYEESLEMASCLGDNLAKMKSCLWLGSVKFQLSRYYEALTYYEMALHSIKQSRGVLVDERVVYGLIGRCYQALGQYDKAIHYHESSLLLAKGTGDEVLEAGIYICFGCCYCSQGHIEKAIRYLKNSLDMAKQLGYKNIEGDAYANLGNCYYCLGQYTNAIGHHEMSLNIAKQLGEKFAEGHAYGNLGLCYGFLEPNEKPLKYFNMCLDIAKQIGNKTLEGKSYCNIGGYYECLGQNDKAIHYFKLSLEIAKQTGDREAEGISYGNLGCLYRSFGLYEKALHNLKICLDISKQIGFKRGEGCAHGNLGTFFLAVGQCGKAIQHCQISLNIAKQLEDKKQEGHICGILGLCYYKRGRLNKAIHYHALYLNISERLGDKLGRGRALSNLGICYKSLGQYDKALHHHEIDLNVSKQVGDKAGEARAFGDLGRCYYSLGQFDKARLHQEMRLEITKQIGDKEGEGRSYHNLGECHLSLGQHQEAELYSMKSLRCYDELFGNVPKLDEFKILIRETFDDTYMLLIIALLLQNKTDEALVIAERSRSRALAELVLANYSVGCTKTFKTEVQELELRDIREVIEALGSVVLFLMLHNDGICAWVLKPNGDVQFKDMRVSLQMQKVSLPVDNGLDFENELNSLICEVHKTRDVHCIASCEDRLLSFLYSEEMEERVPTRRRSLLTSSITTKGTAAPDTEMCSDLPSPTTRKMQKLVMQTASASPSTSRHLNESESDNPLNQLYQIVLGPVRELIEGSQLVVVADGILNMVPFAALKDEESRYVAESLEMRLVPSLVTAKMIMGYPQETKGQARPLIIGDPDSASAPQLPYAREEAIMIGQLLGVEPLIGSEATKEKVIQNLETASLIHIAAHGDMRRGEILLATQCNVDIEMDKKEEFMLTMEDLEKTSIRARLVVLSCCHSARGKVKAEGVIGIARAFIGAGARAVLVALWAISDKATLYFMKKFYEHLIHGKKANESLNRAMEAMRELDAFREPRYWAPFILVGDDISL